MTMDSALETKLIAGLEALEKGASLAEVLARYPEDAEALRPMLETADDLARLRPSPSPAGQRRSRQAFLARAAELKQTPASRPGIGGLLRKVFLVLAPVALFLLLAGGTLAGASGHAVPGDALYPVKRATEDLRLRLATDQAQREALIERFEDERIYEAYEMLDTGREGEVEYYGEIVSLSPQRWEVGNLTMEITEETVVQGTPEVGARIRAVCAIRDGRAFAQTVRILEG